MQVKSAPLLYPAPVPFSCSLLLSPSAGASGALMANTPNTRGPRLGKLKGLKRQEEDEANGDARPPPTKKGGVKFTPLLLMVVMFGPVLLTGLVFVFDYVAASEWGVKVGLSEDPRSRLTKFYQKHNPSKMRDVDKLLRQYEGKYAELFRKLEAKYARPDPRKQKQAEEEEEFLKEQARYEQEAREAQEKF